MVETDMKPEEIGKAYDQITHLWQRDDFNLENGIAQHRRAITFTEKRGKALDVGCGCTGRFIDLLLAEGFTPTGMDVSSEMLALAREKHPQVEFIAAEICQYEMTDKYDFITAWDSIWHIPLDQQRQVISKIAASLNQGGIFIFSFGGTYEEGSHTDDFMGPEVYYSSLGTNGFINLFIEQGCMVRHLEFDQYPELHTYLIVEKL